ncbi:MAG: hypothetical protein Q9195_000610 [Heterodermia aff. obscurata]
MAAVNPKPTDYLYEHAASLAQAANAAAVMASTPYEYYFGPNSPVEPEVDPPPHLAYEKIYSHVRTCARYINRGQLKEFLKAYEYTAQSRANYLVISHKYQTTYHGLQDARAFHDIMTERKSEVGTTLAVLEAQEGMDLAVRKKRSELEAIELQIQDNAKEVPGLLAKTTELRDRRDAVRLEFIAMKKKLNDKTLPELSHIAKQIAQRVRERLTRTAP